MNKETIRNNSWTNLEHSCWKLVQEYELKNKKILIALSAGSDSVALLAMLKQIATAAHFQLAAAYVHHGTQNNLNFRNQSLDFCKSICQLLEVDFISLGPSPRLLKSESDLRKYRRSELVRTLKELEFDLIATGHHADDVLETRLIRLIRGTGVLGLRSIKPMNGIWLRPLLAIKKTDLKLYLKSRGLQWLEDPSNLQTQYLRNWLRNEWLVQLDTYQAGACQSLAHSLENIVESIQEEKLSRYFKNRAIKRMLFEAQPLSKKKTIIAYYLLKMRLKNYTSGFILEVLKHLDNPQKILTFKIGQTVWRANAEQISVEVVTK